MSGDGGSFEHAKSDEDKHKSEFYKDQLDKLSKENEHLKIMKDSLQNHLNFLMKKIRDIKLAKSEDLSEVESLENAGIRFSITESVGLSSRCYTALFDSLEDFSINRDNDEFLVSGLDRLSSDSSDSSYIDLNAYSPSTPQDQPPQVHISRKQMLSPINDADIASPIFSFSNFSNFNEPILLPEDLKGSVLSPEIIIKSPRRSNRGNRSRTRVTEYSLNSQPTSPDAVCNVSDSGLFYTINIPETPPSSQASPMDVIRSYYSAQDRPQWPVKVPFDSSENPWCQNMNPIAELIRYLPFYTCVRGVPRLAKETACKLYTTISLPSGSSSSFEVGESALNPFNITPKIPTKSPLDTEDQPIESHYSELPSKSNNLECESSVSVEYCLPPEEASTCSNNQPRFRSPGQPQTSGPTSSRPLQVSQEKQILKKGILRKLNKKFKVWSNFFCILTNKGLFFYNIKHQPKPEDFFFIQKPVKGISVEIIEKIDLIKVEKSSSDFYLGSFEIVSTCNKSYTLATGDRTECRDWTKALRSVILQHKAGILMQSNNNQLLHKGWVTRVKWGYSKKLWCCLMGHYLIYFNDKEDYFPTGYRDLTGSTVNTNTSVCRNTNNGYNSVGSEISDSLDYPDVFFTISICQDHSTPIFLCIETEQELQTWAHYLRVSITNTVVEELESLRCVNFMDLIRAEYHDQFYYTTGDIYQPVSINTGTLLKTGALQIWKALERLTTLEHYSTRKENIKEKFDRISFIVHTCIEEPGLKDELYVQLMKQSQSSVKRDNKSCQTRRSKFSLFCGGENLIGSGTSIHHDPRLKAIREAEVNSILNMWECLALLIPIFLPSPSVLAILKKYLLMSKESSPDGENEISKYASYCLDQLSYVNEVAGRLRPPSQFEVTTMSTRNPYTHSLPFSIPVYIEPESYQVVSFSALSSIQMVHDSMMLALFSTDLITTLKEVCIFGLYLHQAHGFTNYTFLNPESKICDVISKYEDYLNMKKPESTSIDSVGVIKFVFRIQAFRYSKFLDYYETAPSQYVDVLKMLCHQIHRDVKVGHYSVSGSQLLVLITYLCSAHQTENPEVWHSDQALTQLVVGDMLPESLSRPIDNVQRILSLVLSRLKVQVSEPNICYDYFQYTRYIREICNHQFSPISLPCIATINSDCLPGQQLIIVCQESSVSFLDYNCRICLKRIPISDVLSFGSSSQHFLIAYSLLPTRKCFKRIIFYLPDNCCSLELSNSIVFYSSRSKSQNAQI